jgi:hypothetical protein
LQCYLFRVFTISDSRQQFFSETEPAFLYCYQ